MVIKGRLRPYRVRAYRCSVANRVNDFLMTLPTPDDTELQKEAEEFKRIVAERRKNQDPDFVKVTPSEKERLEQIEAEMEHEYFTDEDVWN